MMPFRFGCQTYTWEMLGHRWKGTPDEILDTVAETGYQGVEFSNAMIGCYGRHPAAFREALAARGLDCAAFAYARTGFTDPTRWEEDLEGAVEALRFCVAVDALLCLGGPAAPSRDHYETDFAQAVRFYNEVALRGADLGVTVCVHPHSHHGSLVESAEEYARLLESTASSGLMFNPDAGHIARSGQDVCACFRAHRDRIAHVHIKDADHQGNWQPLGQGTIPWADLFALLGETRYTGWIVAEEESELAWRDGVAAVKANREYLQRLLG